MPGAPLVPPPRSVSEPAYVPGPDSPAALTTGRFEVTVRSASDVGGGGQRRGIDAVFPVIAGRPDR